MAGRDLDGLPVFLTERMGPAVSGFFRPRILMPLWVVSLPPRERRLVLHHEREHVCAGDLWLVALGPLRANPDALEPRRLAVGVEALPGTRARL
jgi:hypothetical protein